MNFQQRLVGATCLLLCLLPFVGCGMGGDIDKDYGRRRGAGGGTSVNGTAVLAGMFEDAGHRVSSWRRLSPRLEDFDVLVWAPDSFVPPDEETRDRLEEWLRNKPNRTLVYIGRDYDAAADYWSKIQPLAPPEQTMEVGRRLAKARADHAQARTALPKEQYARWFVARRGTGPKTVTQLEAADPAWLDGVDPSKVEITLEGTLDPPTVADIPGRNRSDLLESEVLLRSGGDALVTRVTDPSWDGSQILVVANGSFLLNLPLVNHEHRKLAGKLIDQCGEPAEVAFLESGPEGLPAYDREPDTDYPTGAEVFTVWPLGAIALHLVVLGILFCFAEFPIFGRPLEDDGLSPAVLVTAALGGLAGVLVIASRREETDGESDFGNHIRAMGGLLQSTGDISYAQARLNDYQQHVRRDSGGGLPEIPIATSSSPPTTVS
jgi:hypothetical protein